MSGDPRYTEMSDNPLPPGTYEDDPGGNDDDDGPPSPQRPSSHRKTLPATFDPFIKNPEYERYHQRRASRSRSPDSSYRRSRHNREKSERRRHSRSRSSSYERYHSRRKRDHKHDNRTSARRRRSPTSSRSRSPSRERKSKRSPSHEHRARPHTARTSRRNRSKSRESDHKQYYSRGSKEIAAIEEARADDEEDQEQPKENAFKNDGSFMAMFKKMQEEKERETSTVTSAESGSAPARTFAGFGKRRGGRILKTGIVAKPKAEDENASDDPQDAWSIYLKEVKRYKEACCDDDSKTRPLVK